MTSLDLDDLDSPPTLQADLVTAYYPGATLRCGVSFPWNMMWAAALILTLLLSLAITEAQHYTCSPRDSKVDLTCSDSVYPPNTCSFLPKMLEVRHCNFEQIHRLQSLFPYISKLRFVFTKGWIPREDIFVRWSSLIGLDISNNGIEDLPTSSFSNNRKMRYLNLSHNLLKTISPEVFDNLPYLKYLFLSHNQLQTINLECLAWSYNLKIVNLEFNQLHHADIGPGPFRRLEEINFSHNKLSRFIVSPDIQINFDRLKLLNLSHNKISGRLTRSDFTLLEKNMTVDLSYNNIDRIDLTVRAMDRLRSRYLNSTSTFSTTYIVHNNNLACDCYAGLLLVGAEGRLKFSDFACPDQTRLSEKTQAELQCSVAEYQGGVATSCPWSCHCHYSIIFAQITVNCSSANLRDLPHIDTLPAVRGSDSMVLLLGNNEIQELTEDLSNISIVHLDLSNNKISDIDETKLPTSLKKLVLSTNKLESLSSGMIQYLTQSQINISLSANPLSCRCARLALYQSVHLSEDEKRTFCVFAGIDVSPETAQLVCNDNNYRNLITTIIIVLLFLLFLFYYLLPRRGRKKDFDYDVFISYSHHDAQFTENVLYPELVNNNIKCCIHTLHWEVRSAAPILSYLHFNFNF